MKIEDFVKKTLEGIVKGTEANGQDYTFWPPNMVAFHLTLTDTAEIGEGSQGSAQQKVSFDVTVGISREDIGKNK